MLQNFLKILHEYASRYYDERGLLVNGTTEYRKRRKLRAAVRASRRSSASKTPTEDSDFDSDSEDELDQEEEGEELGEDGPMVLDMYKTMDGTALVAIGDCKCYLTCA